MAKELYAVIHLFQGIVHEIKIFPEWDKAREAADKKIIKAYGELIEEQCGDDEIILEQAEVVFAEHHDHGVLLDKASIRNALIDRMERGGMSVKRSPDFDKQTEDFYLHIEDALTGFLDDQYNMFVEGKDAFEGLYKEIIGGIYKRPWFHGVEHMVIDHEGFVYWKGNKVEHFTLRLAYKDSAKKQAIELGRRCKILEDKGIVPSTGNAVWNWKE